MAYNVIFKLTKKQNNNNNNRNDKMYNTYTNLKSTCILESLFNDQSGQYTLIGIMYVPLCERIYTYVYIHSLDE